MYGSSSTMWITVTKFAVTLTTLRVAVKNPLLESAVTSRVYRHVSGLDLVQKIEIASPTVSTRKASVIVVFLIVAQMDRSLTEKLARVDVLREVHFLEANVLESKSIRSN